MEELFAFDADLVVLAIGENVPPLESEDARSQFKAGVLKILRCALARRHPLVVVRSCFSGESHERRDAPPSLPGSGQSRLGQRR